MSTLGHTKLQLLSTSIFKGYAQVKNYLFIHRGTKGILLFFQKT